MIKKPAFFFGLIAIAVILVTFFSIRSFQPVDQEFKAGDVWAFRRLKNQLLKQQVGSPFYQDQGFDSLVYFLPTELERYKVEIQPVPDGEELDLLPDRPGYPSHKIAYLAQLKKELWTDTLYILKDLEEASDSLFFIPFQDETNGKETYGGGRYLDLVIKPGRPVYLDFNLAYNPYCAYKEAFVCAKVPSMNRLSRAIAAGEKKYPGH
jgi:uncharacterized protein (DUF1684 family)